MHHPESLFYEEQRFDQAWIRLVVYGSTLLCTTVFGWGLIQQLVFKRPWGNDPTSDTALIITAICIVGMCWGLVWLFEAMRLRTEVRRDGLEIRFAPLLRRHIPLEDIAEAYARTYRPVREYGGWGIRWGPGGRAYNVKGNEGVQLVLTNGSRLLIGSQNAGELAEAIRVARRRR
jgi:hypothetical protein